MTAGVWVLLVALVATLFSAGVIWFMQMVEYPLFAFVGQEAFPKFHTEHNRRLPGVVFLPMVATFALLVLRPEGVPLGLAVLGSLFVAVVLVTSFALLIPRHLRLSRDGYALKVIAELVKLNWLRTVAWTAHALTLLTMLAMVLHKI